MKKGLIVILILLVISFIIGFIFYKNNKDNENERLKKEQKIYDEIRESVKDAVEWNISAMYPKCSISYEFKETTSPGRHYNSWFLINNGYIKQNELLDVDGESYCDVYVDINTYYEDELDHQNNCEIYYKIYLKCKDYEDEGYINWG